MKSDRRQPDWAFVNNSKKAVLSFLCHNPCFSRRVTRFLCFSAAASDLTVGRRQRGVAHKALRASLPSSSLISEASTHPPHQDFCFILSKEQTRHSGRSDPGRSSAGLVRLNQTNRSISQTGDSLMTHIHTKYCKDLGEARSCKTCPQSCDSIFQPHSVVLRAGSLPASSGGGGEPADGKQAAFNLHAGFRCLNGTQHVTKTRFQSVQQQICLHYSKAFAECARIQMKSTKSTLHFNHIQRTLALRRGAALRVNRSKQQNKQQLSVGDPTATLQPLNALVPTGLTNRVIYPHRPAS